MIGPLVAALDAPAYSLTQAQRTPLLLDGLNELTARHYAAGLPYRRIVDGALGGLRPAAAVEDVPYLPVSLFKTQRLQSIADEAVRVTLTSSGTTGQTVSRIVLDTDTSTIQQKALANSLVHVLGKRRLPMLVIDTGMVFKDPRRMSARGAGVLGLMRYGRSHAFALDPDLEPDVEAVRAFLAEHGDQPFFMFGFTFVVWMHFYERFRDSGIDLSNGILIHSGGWKKMVERSVDNATFRHAFKEAFGLTRIYNFYGMVEQIGSIFLEGPDGLLFPPNSADVIIRDPRSWQPLPPGQPGVIQLLSLLPHSYPGHSVLTEDMGVVESVDPGIDGWNGRGLRVLGRVAKAELRGCSDVIATAAA